MSFKGYDKLGRLKIKCEYCKSTFFLTDGSEYERHCLCPHCGMDNNSKFKKLLNNCSYQLEDVY